MNFKGVEKITRWRGKKNSGVIRKSQSIIWTQNSLDGLVWKIFKRCCFSKWRLLHWCQRFDSKVPHFGRFELIT